MVYVLRRNLIDKGVLTTWILTLRSARQLGLKSTGHAARGTSSPPGPSIWISHIASASFQVSERTSVQIGRAHV